MRIFLFDITVTVPCDWCPCFYAVLDYMAPKVRITGEWEIS